MNTYLIKKHNIIVNLYDDIDLTEFGHVYLLRNMINNKCYIGQSVRIKNRLSEHIQNVINNKNNALCNAINKHGINNFEFNVIDFANDINSLNEKEVNHIKINNSNNRLFGYNIEEGGKNALASDSTKRILSNQRKGREQNSEWIQKRILEISKPVLKINKINNVILERYASLADAGRNNMNNLTYEQILRKCLGYSKNSKNTCWCYEENFYQNNFNVYKQKTYKPLTEFSVEELDNIYKEHGNNKTSIRQLSEKYSIHFSTLSKYIDKKNSPESQFKPNTNYISVCKITNKRFSDYINKSGSLTVHISKINPDFVLDSKFKRKQIEIKTGKPWYYNYFDFIEN